MKHYVVISNDVVKIYENHQKAVKDYPKAFIKSFKNKEEAEKFLNEVKNQFYNVFKKEFEEKAEKEISEQKKVQNSAIGGEKVFSVIDMVKDKKTMVAFVDGSYSDKYKVFSYAGILFYKDIIEEYAKASNKMQLMDKRNIAGEIMASLYSIQKAVELNLERIYIFYDCESIERWADDDYIPKSKLATEYKEFCMNMRKRINIYFKKVKAHTDVKYNNHADELTRIAIDNYNNNIEFYHTTRVVSNMKK